VAAQESGDIAAARPIVVICLMRACVALRSKDPFIEHPLFLLGRADDQAPPALTDATVSLP
jgi:hypothetical protein